MPKRIKKDGDIRKLEFIAAAMALFQKKGYEKTSVQNIIDKLKLTKGAFYHYFESKEDILIAISEMFTKRIADIMKEIIEDSKLNALQKFNKIIVEVQAYKAKHTKEKVKYAKMFQGQISDPKFQDQMMRMAKSVMNPILKDLFEKGVQEGVFKTEYPEQIAEHYFDIMSSLKKSLIKPVKELQEKPNNIRIIKYKLLFFQDLLEKLLGVKKGDIHLAEPLLKRYVSLK